MDGDRLTSAGGGGAIPASTNLARGRSDAVLSGGEKGGRQSGWCGRGVVEPIVPVGLFEGGAATLPQSMVSPGAGSSRATGFRPRAVWFV